MRWMVLVLSFLFLSTIPVLAQEANNSPQPEARRTFYQGGSLHTKAFYLGDQLHGVYKEYYENKRIKKKAVYKNGVLDGYVKYHRGNGTLEKMEFYDNGTLTETKMFNVQGQPIE